jgi:glycosyltransferase involved in cell wall biosynthesis
VLNFRKSIHLLTILWLLDIEHQYRDRHGATLRYTNFSKGLIARGHRVYYLVTNRPNRARKERAHYLEELKKGNFLTDFFEVDEYKYPRLKGKLSKLAIHPRAQSWLLTSAQAEYKNRIYELVRQLSADICIISERACLFLLPELSRLSATVIDWCESSALYEAREIRLLLRAGEFRQLATEGKALIDAVIEEVFYGRYAAANIVVSRADKRVLDRLNGRPLQNHVVHNGVTVSAQDAAIVTKWPGRLIFSGSMNFPPNYKGAVWFIENVMPLVIERNKTIQLVIAGQKPIPELLAKANEHINITGLVPDLRAEISKSQLYIAPLISGTGFRNKVIEAIASGTYVIGTPMALEFLDDRLRRTLLVAKTPKDFAAQIEEFLKNPRAFDDRLSEAMGIVREKYQWANRVKELENLCHQVLCVR